MLVLYGRFICQWLEKPIRKKQFCREDVADNLFGRSLGVAPPRQSAVLRLQLQNDMGKLVRDRKPLLEEIQGVAAAEGGIYLIRAKRNFDFNARGICAYANAVEDTRRL